MKTIYLEEDLFYEDEVKDTKSIISKYFNIEPIDISSFFMSNRILDESNEFRASLNVAKFFGKRFEYANAMKWAPYFRDHLLFPYDTYFMDLTGIYNCFLNEDFKESFIRPCDGFKDFSGQVFGDFLKFQTEYNFMTRNKNVDRHMMCLCSPASKDIRHEYRCIFVNKTYISGSEYMRDFEKFVSSEVPDAVMNFAISLSRRDYFLNIPNFVIDVAVDSDNVKYLLEINAFETASFYEADLDLIYSEWSKQ